MAKLNVSHVLGHRKRIRIATIIIGLFLVATLVQGLVFRNPGGLKAANITVAGNTLTLTGKFLIDQDMNPIVMDDGEGIELGNDLPRQFPASTYTLTGKDVIIDGAGTEVKFLGVETGQTINLNSLKITNGARVTQFGPGISLNQTNIMNPDYWGVIIDGWLKAPTYGTGVPWGLRLYSDDRSRIYIGPNADWKTNSAINAPYGYQQIYTVTPGQWYRFRIYLVEEASVAQVAFTFPNNTKIPPLNVYADHVFGTDTGSNQQMVRTQYYQKRLLNSFDPNVTTDFTLENLMIPSNLESINNANQAWITYGSLSPTSRNPGIMDLPYERKLNFSIAGDLTIGDGGSIDVSGKGYSSGNISHDAGYGPGGGDTVPDNGRGGGGYGGHGGQGNHASGFDFGGGGVSYGSAIDPSDLGSGGGGLAGHGGGLVKIFAANILLNNNNAIMAQGDPALGGGTLLGQKSGGGSGGSVNLTSDVFNIGPLVTSTVIDASGNNGGDNGQGSGSESGGNGGGGRIAIHAPTLQGVNYDSLMYPSAGNPKYLLVESGVPGVPRPGIAGRVSLSYEEANVKCVTDSTNGCAWIVNYGERGTIYIGQRVNGSNIKKELIPVKRGQQPVCVYNEATPSPNCFNPYALQVGDIIQVKLTVSNLVLNAPVSITDNWLKNSSGVARKCRPISNNATDYPFDPIPDSWLTNPNNPSDPVVWSGFRPVSPTINFSYYCQVGD